MVVVDVVVAGAGAAAVAVAALCTRRQCRALKLGLMQFKMNLIKITHLPSDESKATMLRGAEL